MTNTYRPLRYSVDQIVADYPYLDADDVRAALAYAAWRSVEVDLPLRAS